MATLSGIMNKKKLVLSYDFFLPHVDPGFAAIARGHGVDYYDVDLDAHDEGFDGDDENWVGMDSSVLLEIGVGGHYVVPILKMLDAV